jgi:hypothetical protein
VQRHHLSFTLAEGYAALPRLVSVLHGRGVCIAHLRFEGTSGCIEVLGGHDLATLTSVLARNVDIVEVGPVASCTDNTPVPLPTRHVVVRQDAGRPPHPRGGLVLPAVSASLQSA